MSFEGFYQKLCKKGHYFEEDVYSIESKVCPVCDSEIVFTNMVDITNGSYDENENRIDGYIDFERHGFKILVEDSSYPEVLEGNLIPVENTIEIERFDFLGIMRQTINKGI